MKYLVLTADYGDYSLRSEFEEDAQIRRLLCTELQVRLERWNESYQAVVHLPEADRASDRVAAQIRQLDTEGLALANAIATELRPAKVKYFSEGLLRHLQQVYVGAAPKGAG